MAIGDIDRPGLAPQTPCDLAQGWLISLELAERLWRVGNEFRQGTGRTLLMISGFRSLPHQDCLRGEGRPAADNDKSTHTTCPATGADISMTGMASRAHKVEFGRLAVINRLRWGGGSPLVDGIPTDWNHVDLGPRQ